MQQLRNAINQMIGITDDEFEKFVADSEVKIFKKQEYLNQPPNVPNHIYFINNGLLRLSIIDLNGDEHTTHFALENQFIADYSNFIMQTTSIYHIQALELSECVVIPRNSIEWGYKYLTQGEKLGRMIAEYYFMFLEEKIKTLYIVTPKDRYDNLGKQFYNIHNRVPQHLIASFLGISPIHLSQLKKADSQKV
ncbi:MAG: Crp/Fnr family transcriptional regulator [Bacteroidota bacterium]|nr:Crp/Fnr family transcriptional regulator [Bacteroidota bacterium]